MGIDCSRCLHCIKHDPDDFEQWCEKEQFEKFPYERIKDCEFFERKENKNVNQCMA